METTLMRQLILSVLSVAIFVLIMPPVYAGDLFTGLPVKQLKDFALAQDASTLSQDYPKYREIGSGRSLYIVPKPLSVGEGFAKIYAESQQSQLCVPLGWLVMETMGGTVCFTPDQSVQIFLRTEAGRSFSDLRTNAVTEFKSRLPQSNATVNKFDTNDGDFAIEASPIPWRGAQASMLRVFTPHPHQPLVCKSVTLVCPEGQLQKYEPLIAAMLNSRTIDWDYRETAKGYAKEVSEADCCKPIAVATMQALVDHDATMFKGVISAKALAAMGGTSKFKESFDKDAGFVKDVLLPPLSSEVESYAEPIANKPVAFKYYFRTTTGKYKRLDVVVVRESGRLVVSEVSLRSIDRPGGNAPKQVNTSSP
jgi:hypothetical protein